MDKKIKLFNSVLFLSAVFFINGCTSSQIASTTATDLLLPAASVGGGMIGAYATRDDSSGTQIAATAAGVGGGYLLGEFLKQGFKDEKAKEFKYGYDLGRANVTKSLYWNYQQLHRFQNGSTEKRTIYRLPASYPKDGINRVTSDIYLPVVE